MADQAQGLRALANQKRHVLFGADDSSGHSGDSFPNDDFSNTEFSGVSSANGTGVHAPSRADVLNPEAAASDSRDSLSTLYDAAGKYHVGTADCSELLPVEAGIAAVDGRMRERALSSSPVLLRSPDRSVASADTTAGRRQATARVVAVTSGKGGVGKTNFCSNLALTLAARGQRVIIVDADLGLANVHVVMGVAPRFHLEHVMRGEKTLRDVLYQTPGGVGIIGGGSGLADMANLDDVRRQRFIGSLSELDSLADVVLLDTGAGLSHNVLAFLCAVDEVIVVTTPEPTAITDAYATIKVLSQENPHALQRLVINMAQSEAEAHAVAQRLQSIAQRFLQRELSCLGYIPHDMTVSRAVRAQQPFTVAQPASPASRAIVQIAARLGYELAPPPAAEAGVGGLLTRMQRFFQRPPSGKRS